MIDLPFFDHKNGDGGCWHPPHCRKIQNICQAGEDRPVVHTRGRVPSKCWKEEEEEEEIHSSNERSEIAITDTTNQRPGHLTWKEKKCQTSKQPRCTAKGCCVKRRDSEVRKKAAASNCEDDQTHLKKIHQKIPSVKSCVRFPRQSLEKS